MCLLWLVFAWSVRAQLAITEVLPVSKVNTNSGFHGAEFWELTNFGTNDIDLHGYGFRDSRPLRPLLKYPFDNLVIRAGESVIFFRIEPDNNWVVTPEHFKAWWGASNLAAGIQCRSYDSKHLGLSAWDGDEVQVIDDRGNLVDRVRFSSIQYGFSFTYDASTGFFGEPSAAGEDGAFTAALTPDVGSPGTTAGPVPVQFLKQPADIDADGGMTVTFQAEGGGMPPPKYQWFFKNLPIVGAKEPSLTLSNVQSSDAGGYRVVITNGLSTASSVSARLSVNTNPTPASVISAPADTHVFLGQTAVFSVRARGYPPPAYQWRTNGVTISGAVSPTLELADVGGYLNGAEISAVVSNQVGSAVAAAILTVTPWPDLRFTEVMAGPANPQENRHFGWVELTNFDTNTVDLFGWRFAEENSFAKVVIITNELRLAPGESVVLAERLDQTRFARWWGTNTLPENFKLYTYSGFGLETNGGAFILWNAAARDPHSEVVAGVSWAGSTQGVSYECEHTLVEGKWVTEAYLFSTLGIHGAFASADRLDIGSPGYTDSPALKIVSIAMEPRRQVAITCKVIPGRRYQLWRFETLESASWLALQTRAATNNLITFVEDASAGSAFYRVEALP
jgi:hypothetical protein